MDHDLIVPEAKLDQIIISNYRGSEDFQLSFPGSKNQLLNKWSKKYEMNILDKDRFQRFAILGGNTNKEE